MSDTPVWSIDELQVKAQEGQYTDVVVIATWRCMATHETANPLLPLVSNAMGQCRFSAPSGSFTPYADLTQDQVLTWCWDNGVDKDGTEAKVAAQLDLLVNPPLVTPPLPWAQTE